MGRHLSRPAQRATTSFAPAKSIMDSTRLPPPTCRPAEATEATDPQDAVAFAKRIAHKRIWVEPKLLAEIEYRAESSEGKVQHPFFKGLRADL